jgi:peptidoglycan/LPS O-acetylase OafA/YrhL
MKYYKQLDGIKGIACFAVMLGHMYGAFLSGNVGEAHFDFDSNIILKIFNVLLLNGSFWVCVFCVISGFLYAGIEGLNQYSLHKKLLHRYVNLSLPVLICAMLIVALEKSGLFYHTEYYLLTGNQWLVESLPLTNTSVIKSIFDAIIDIPLLFGGGIYADHCGV